jgi:two-component sensor histidine kinase
MTLIPTDTTDQAPSLEEALRLIVEGTAAVTGRDFFRALVRHLAAVLRMRYALVAEVTEDGQRARPLAWWTGEGLGENDSYDLADTPCEQVTSRHFCHFPSGTWRLFPRDHLLRELEIESYLGVTLRSSTGRAMGILNVMHHRPMAGSSAVPESILKIFAARAAAELERQHAEEALQRANDELEDRLRLRTRELDEANMTLRREIEQRARVEDDLRQSEQRLRQLFEQAQETAQSNRRLLMEVDHRVRNNLAGLLSLLAIMREQATDVESFSRAIESRLLAMSHVHHLLMSAGGGSIDLQTLISTLLPTVEGGSRLMEAIEIGGPPVAIATRQTLPLAMTLLEWFTNSRRHGALTSRDGRVTVSWITEPAGEQTQVRLRWQESGGPPIERRIVPSLGTRLIESFVSVELHGQCELRYPPSGADHCIQFLVE